MAERRRLLRLAYRHLGSVAEAEDAVQDAWLRFAGAAEIANPAHFLSRTVTNLCLDRLKSAARRRETYIGPWLPEPIVEAAGTTDPETGDAALDISFAVMRALERLSPLERAALFLHDLFDMPFEEIARTLDRSPATCRQLASRARQALRRNAARFQPDQTDIQRFVAGLAEALASGDIEPLKRMLAADAEIVSDGGGKVTAAMNVIRGADRVARFLFGIAGKARDRAAVSLAPARINGAPGLLVFFDGRLDQTIAFSLDKTGAIAAIYMVRNPDKLAGARAAVA